jgi:hypothetical protein
MQALLKTLIRILPQLSILIFILLFQLAYGWTNITGTVLYSILYLSKGDKNTTVLALIISCFYDSVKMIPLASWILAYFIGALPIYLFQTIIKSLENEKWSLATAIRHIIQISISSFIQLIVLNKIIGRSSFDMISVYIIIGLTTIIVIAYRMNSHESTLHFES